MMCDAFMAGVLMGACQAGSTMQAPMIASGPAQRIITERRVYKSQKGVTELSRGVP
jgi:hypothetical protein